VYKYSHDVAPAQAALGAGGCTDCHAFGSAFFQGAVLDTPFAPDDGRPRWIPNYTILGYSASRVAISAFREQHVKPFLYGISALVAILALLVGLRRLALTSGVVSPHLANRSTWAAVILCAGSVVLIAVKPELLPYMLVRRFTLDANHFWIGASLLLGAVIVCLAPLETAGRRAERWLRMATSAMIAVTSACGALMLVGPEVFGDVGRIVYTGFDAGLALVALALSIRLSWLLGVVPNPTQETRHE
jgi:hypothetical protein